MSSPPPSASSPTGMSFTLPQKRPSLSNLGSQSSQKRRKASFASASSHPLRQTSFPPPGAASPTYPPSRQSSFSPSVSSGFAGRGAGSGGGKKRKQHARANSQAADAASKTGGDDSRSKREADPTVGQDNEDGEDDDDNGDAEDTLLESSGLAAAGSKEESENLALLLDKFTQDQEERYAAYRRVKLKKEVVRRIVNQTLSQSVPQSIVTTINGYTKVFIGDLIERARDVQSEWIAARHMGEAARITNSVDGEKKDATTSQITHNDPRKIDENERGPLTPDHLREALRRYKKDQEGGSAGFQGLSLYGVEVAASRSGGRRLFR